MHEVAIPSPIARLLLVLPARSLPEICDRREVCHDWSTRIKAACEGTKGGRGLLLFAEIHVHVAHLR